MVHIYIKVHHPYKYAVNTRNSRRIFQPRKRVTNFSSFFVAIACCRARSNHRFTRIAKINARCRQIPHNDGVEPTCTKCPTTRRCHRLPRRRTTAHGMGYVRRGDHQRVPWRSGTIVKIASRRISVVRRLIYTLILRRATSARPADTVKVFVYLKYFKL